MEQSVFDSIMRGANEALQHVEGSAVKGMVVHVPNHVDVRSIRKHTGMTQIEFSHTFGFALSTLKKWETQNREPEASAKVLLRTIAQYPDVVIAANSQPSA